MSPRPGNLVLVASPCTWLSHAPSTINESDSHSSVGASLDVPRSRLPGQCRPGPPWVSQVPDVSLAAHAVRLDPAGVSSVLALTNAYCCLPVDRHRRPPDFFFRNHEAQSLPLRYGLDIALSTLDSCRYLHQPKTRFLVRGLVPLARAGIAPAEDAKLGLAYRSPSGSRQAAQPRRCDSAG
jgi:hypothetical protein